MKMDEKTKEKIGPYIKFLLQSIVHQPIDDGAVDVLCNKEGGVRLYMTVGEGYSMVLDVSVEPDTRTKKADDSKVK